MSWQNDVEELQRRQEIARQMGGSERVAKQHGKERLTVRERIGLLFDQSSFQEIGTLAGKAMYGDDGSLQSFTPSSVVMGYGRIKKERIKVKCAESLFLYRELVVTT